MYDSVGKDTWERSLRLLRPRGSFVLFGASSGPGAAHRPANSSHAPDRSSSAGPRSAIFMRTRAEATARATEVFDAILAGTLDVRVGQTYALGEAPRAHRDLEARAHDRQIDPEPGCSVMLLILRPLAALFVVAAIGFFRVAALAHADR